MQNRCDTHDRRMSSRAEAHDIQAQRQGTQSTVLTELGVWAMCQRKSS